MIDPVSPVNSVRYNQSLKATEKINSGVAPPASAYSSTEMARAEINAAQLMTASTLPTGDGLFSVGNVAVKVIKDMGKFVSSVRSSWGF